jgi:signal transduction histidine kinase
VYPTELLRSTIFRTAAIACAAFATTTLLLFGFIYWQTAGLETSRIDSFIRNEHAALLRESPAVMAADVNSRYGADLHRQSFAAIFAPSGEPIAGTLTAMPPGLAEDGNLHDVRLVRRGDHGPTAEIARVVAGRLTNGGVLLVGRSVQDLAELRTRVARALWLGLLPALAASLAIGLYASQRTIVRVRAVNRAIARIMQGHLQERLPSAGTSDALDQLAESCNRMLVEIERLMDEVKGVGDSIAHDLRGPLARLRFRLETGRTRARTQAELDEVVAQGLQELDQTLAIITALLRIGELQTDRRQAAFRLVGLASLLREVAELYAPLAEHRGLTFQLTLGPDGEVLADRALLLEAIVNLLDNAIKFVPAQGMVAVQLMWEDGRPVVRVCDSGPGIPVPYRQAVLGRFYRAPNSRHVSGSGLGLSLVSAILRLHGFDLRMSDTAGGFAVDILCAAPDCGAAQPAIR